MSSAGQIARSFKSRGMAAAVTMVRPKWGWFFAPLAVLVGMERVLENAHYFSDVVGGVGFGAGGAILVQFVLRRWLEVRPDPPAFPVAQPPPPPAEPATMHP